MPFNGAQAASNRLLSDPQPLTEEEIRDLLPYANTLPNAAKVRLEAELPLIQLAALVRQEKLAHRQLDSFDKFDQSTAKANRWMIWFTAAVTVMTLLMLVIAIYDAWKR